MFSLYLPTDVCHKISRTETKYIQTIKFHLTSINLSTDINKCDSANSQNCKKYIILKDKNLHLI